MIRPVPGDHDLQRLAVPSLGLGVMAAFELHRSEVDEVVRHVRVPRAVEPAVEGEDLLVQRVGLRVLTGVEVTVGQLGEARREVSLEAGTPRLEPHRLLELADRIGVPAGVLQDPTQRRDGARYLGIAPREVSPEHRQTFPDLLLGLVVPATRARELTAGDQRAGHVGVVGPECRATELERAGEQRLRLVQPAQVLGDAAERLQQLGLHRRLGLERLRLADAPVDQVHHLHVGGGADLAGSSLEQLEHELLDPLRPRGLGSHRVAGPREANGGVRGHSQHRETDRRGDEHRPGVPPQELPGPVGQRVRPCVQRLSGQVIAQIADQRLDRRVPPRRIALHRGEAQDVQVRPRGAARLHRPAGHLRGSRRFLLQHQPRGLVGLESGQIERQSVRRAARRASRRARRRRCARRPAAAHLLRRGVGRGHQAQAGARRSSPGRRRVELLGDAEVEQLHRPVGRHQDVRRLEIAVDDAVAVRVLHRLAHRAEQPQPLGRASSCASGSTR